MESFFEALVRCKTKFVTTCEENDELQNDITDTIQVGSFMVLEKDAIVLNFKHKYAEKYCVVLLSIGGGEEGVFTYEVKSYVSNQDADPEPGFQERTYYLARMTTLFECGLIALWQLIGSYGYPSELEVFGHFCKFGCLYCNE